MAHAQKFDSGPEVAHNFASAPEVVPTSDLEHSPVVYPDSYNKGRALPAPNSDFSDKALELKSPKSQGRRICGLSPKAFWIVIIGIVIILAGAVGGGIGGGLASQGKRQALTPMALRSFRGCLVFSVGLTCDCSVVLPQPPHRQ